MDEKDQGESIVGQKLSSITTRKVICVVLIMLISQPLFDSSTYVTNPDSLAFGLSLIYRIGGGTKIGQQEFKKVIDMQKELPYTPLLALFIDHKGTKIMSW